MENISRTGYASIDKPHYKFYRQSPIREFDTDQTSYQLIFNSNKDNMDYDAIGYFGNYLKYHEFKDEVDKAAAAYKKLGDYHKSLEYLEKLLEIEPQAVNARALKKLILQKYMV